MDSKKISHYLKPKLLQQLLQRSGSMLDIPLAILDLDGNEIAASGNSLHRKSEPYPKVFSPIMVRGNLFGTLVGYETGTGSGDRLKHILDKVVEHITDLILSEIKLDSMSEELLHNYKILNLFYNVSNALVNILNVRKVSYIILDQIVATIGISKASVLLLDSTRKHLVVVAHKGLPGEEVENTLFNLEESVCNEVIQRAKPLFVQNIDHYPGLKKRSKGTYRSNSFISVPILKSGREESQEVMGVINVADKLSGETFYSGDLKLIMALTSLASMSIQNAKYVEEVERGKEEWERTFDAITDTVAILDPSYRFCRVNHAYKNYGFSKEDLIHKTCYQAFYKKERPCPGCPVTRTLLTGAPSYAEKRAGERIFRQWTYPVQGQNGLISSVVIYTRDVSSLKKLKERLTQSERMASIGQIAAGVAHEIRNPLGSILTAIDVLSSRAGGAEDENFYTLSEVIKVEAKRLNQIISDFLLYASPHKPMFRENNLNQVMEEVIRLIRPEAEKEKVKIEVHLDSSMPVSCFDSDRIKQVIWNILINGIQAMNTGGTLTVSTRRLSSQMEFRVRDQGFGIRKEDMNKIFDPFYTTKTSGTGLGLSIVNRIVENHKGMIDIQSPPGEGAEFIVTLPVGNMKQGG